ncbi:MAG: hypothetical protein WB780_22290 [Candidatus Acidiferrales bacterium]
MEKILSRLSFWLCCVCAVFAIISRVLNAWGLPSSFLLERVNPIGYHSFMDGVLLFTMISIATACFAYVKRNGA